jgi:VCBS repeat-containing protein
MSANNDIVNISEETVTSGNVQTNDTGDQTIINGDTRWIKFGGSTGTQGDYTVVASSGDTTIDGDFGTLIIRRDGSYTYTPDQGLDTGETGTDVFRYIAGPNNSFTNPNNDAANISFTVSGANDAPVVNTVIGAQTINEDTAWSFTPTTPFKDVDVETLTYSATLDGAALPAWLSFNTTTGKFSGTPPTNFNGSYSIAMTASDGTATASQTFALNVTPVNDAPTGAAPTTLTALNENTARTITTAELLGTLADVDGALSITGLTVSSGNGAITGTGPWTYTPVPNDSSSVTFSYTITGGGNNIAKSVTMDLVSVNSAPTNITLTGGTVDENAGAALVGTLSATDAQGGTMTYVITDPSSPFEIKNGDKLYVKAGAGLDYETLSSHTVNVQVTDASGLTFSKGLTVGVTNVNEAPTAVADNYTMNEDGVLSPGAIAGVLANDSDPDGGKPGSLAVMSSPTHGTLDINGSGNFTYTPVANWSGTDTFTYAPVDAVGGGLGNTVTVSIVVNAVNDAPVVTGPVTLTAIAEDSGARTIIDLGRTARPTLSDVDSTTVDQGPVAISGTRQGHAGRRPTPGTWTYTPALNDDTAVSLQPTRSPTARSTSPPERQRHPRHHAGQRRAGRQRRQLLP